MPPCLDLYIPVARTRAVIDRFLSRYADLSKDMRRADFSVLLTDTAVSVETGTLEATLAFGLADPSRAFALYFASRLPRVNGVLMYFSPRDRLLLGLSIEAYGPDQPNEAEAQRLLTQLCTEFGASKALFDLELAPADADEQLNFLS
ncbi:hypothetical protein [Hymenobacter edaphi]|uniref:Uncharacterized protein n=1 Tax=Hymenobacter edaphi TaxID=2211146 RepID=A0A328BYV6_9BACT|nr:hypothetical protein [Hymenobacter edaphi]RAK70318.1 hypothetical protein DLM85_05595 [Hymenobacter edaphi]